MRYILIREIKTIFPAQDIIDISSDDKAIITIVTQNKKYKYKVPDNISINDELTKIVTMLNKESL